MKVVDFVSMCHIFLFSRGLQKNSLLSIHSIKANRNKGTKSGCLNVDVYGQEHTRTPVLQPTGRKTSSDQNSEDRNRPITADHGDQMAARY